MKKLFAILLTLVLVIPSTSLAYNAPMINGGYVLRANPNTNVDDPKSLTYSSNFAIKNSTDTPSLQVPSDGGVTVTFSNAYMDFGSTRTPTIHVIARYRSGSVWKSATISPASIKVSKKKKTYTFSVSGLKGSAFYIGLSKTEYPQYYFRGDIEVAD